jgi:hypothetical protein
MPNKTINDEAVKWPSKKKYNCKRNKGEHEYLTPTVEYKPDILYIYKTDGGELHTHQQELSPEYKYLRTEMTVVYKSVCKHCGKVMLSFLTDKLK